MSMWVMPTANFWIMYKHWAGSRGGEHKEKEHPFPWAAEQPCTREQVRGMWEGYCQVFCYHGNSFL